MGLERELRQKSAGLRTHTLVGVSAALFMLVSKYGFMDVLANDRVVLDPSRVAAQVVSGIGFIGGGIIFMRRDMMRGLTTAASIWLTAGLGMACGAGLPLCPGDDHRPFRYHASLPQTGPSLTASPSFATEIQISYEDGRELLRTVLIKCTEFRFAIGHVRLDRDGRFMGSREEVMDMADHEGTEIGWRPDKAIVTLHMQVKGKRPNLNLVTALCEIDGVHEVGTVNDDTELD